MQPRSDLLTYHLPTTHTARLTPYLALRLYLLSYLPYLLPTYSPAYLLIYSSFTLLPLFCPAHPGLSSHIFVDAT